MGRMADARKRARRAAPVSVPEPYRRRSRSRKRCRASRCSPTSRKTRPAGPRWKPARAARPWSLPASGLAEDILAQLEGGPLAAGAAPAAVGATALPASGLAEEVLGREQTLSFFSAPAQQQRAAAEATEHLATFFLDREEYGVDVKQVQEIRRVTEITSVPRAPEFVRGVINLRGRILPVLDLRRRLGLGEVVVASRAPRIVVVRVKERLLGLLVDGASQVLKVPGLERSSRPRRKSCRRAATTSAASPSSTTVSSSSSTSSGCSRASFAPRVPRPRARASSEAADGVSQE